MSAIAAALKPRFLFSILIALIGMSTPGYAEQGLFGQGSMRMSIFVGNDAAFDRTYTVLGLGYGYYVADGLEAGLDVESWLGGGPGITRVSPQLRVVWDAEGRWKPYAGAFYSRTIIENYKDNDTLGLRGGAFYLYGRNAYFGVGLIHDWHLNCDRTVYASCEDTYPEVVVAVMF